MTTENDKLRILFVCLGNICRSPLAEGVFRHHVERAGLADRFDIDSAGTSSYHEGDPPDPRTTAVARTRGIVLTGRSRQIKRTDLDDFDYVIVMDAQNHAAVQRLAKATSHALVHLLREFDAQAKHDRDVPDPYYGGVNGFEDVHDMVDRSAEGLLQYLKQEHGL